MNHRDLTSYIRTVEDFPEAGVSFKDLSPMFQSPEGFNACVLALAEQSSHYNFDKIACIDARGFIFGSTLAHHLAKPFFLIRKEGKLPGNTLTQSYELEYGSATLAIQEDALLKGQSVMIIDDILATGGTLKASCQLIEQLGGHVVACQVVLELEALKGRETLKRIEIKSLIQQ